MDPLQQHLSSVFNLSAGDAGIFLSRFTKTNLRKNELFMAEGKVCHKIGLIEKGLMKCVYNRNGEETVFEFSWENNFIADYYSFVTHTPSEKEIRCMEDTTLYVITRDELEELAKEHAFVVGLSRTINEKLFLRLHERLRSMLLDTASERYQKLLAEKSDLAQRVPQYLIASYLNVKPETISRIRKKLTPG
jgi:CRP-like cAMP-binding protein